MREILISESAWEEMTCLFAPSLTDVQIETLALYSFGASHNQISEVLNIAVGTSKNRVNRILAALPIRTREEVFYFLFASRMAFSFCKVVTELIGSRVNKLLTK
ncbi:hypothetical protein PAG51_25810 [Klebsiella pneumoniae]|nr:hypothetical protein [Klebsiella pneumoniae]